jgi:hypothetical protein
MIILAGVYDHRQHFNMGGVDDGYRVYEPKSSDSTLTEDNQGST